MIGETFADLHGELCTTVIQRGEGFSYRRNDIFLVIMKKASGFLNAISPALHLEFENCIKNSKSRFQIPTLLNLHHFFFLFAFHSFR